MKVKPLLILLYVVLITFRALFAQSGNDNTRIKFFNKDLFKRHLNFLGNDSTEGRAPGTRGGNLTAKYLAHEFEKLKLKPLGDYGSYHQNIPFHSTKPKTSCELIISTPDTSVILKLNSDFLLYRSGESVFFPKSVPLVFAGYGITAPEFSYDDYKNINVEGKIVVILEGEPVSFDPSYFDGDYPTIYSLPEAKQRIALSKGAKGTIMLPNPQNEKNDYWNSRVRAFSFEYLSLATAPSTSLDIMINPAKASLLFSDSKYSIENIYDLHEKHRIESFPLNVRLTFDGEFSQRDFVSPNIIGMIEGSDPELKDSYIIVSAHYDHLGIGMPVKGDSIYNGVFDNAEGVAAVLEITRNFLEKNFVNKRSIIFLITTGEESGLLGSYFYTLNPVVPLYKTIADINIDGIASFDNFKSVIGVGSEYSTLVVYLEKITRERKLKIAPIPSEFADFGSFSKSDQHSFAKAGIPSILISEGLDYVNLNKEEGMEKMINYSTNIYHSPSDDLNQKINFNAVAQHLEILSTMIENLANDNVAPEWLDNSPFKKARMLSREMRK